MYKTQDLIMIAEFAKQTLVLSQKIEKGLARAYRSIGIVFSEQSNYSKALKYHLKAKELQEK